VLSSLDPVPLFKNENENWLLEDDAKYKLTDPNFANEYFHVISVGGRTRAGKSFLMKNIIEMVEQTPGGKCHFGAFVDLASMDSCTKGMDIALVEYNGNLLLLVDCEGLASMQIGKKMDPKLMVIMSMISQKIIYLDLSLDTDALGQVNQMLINRNIALDASGVPLDTLYFVLNKCSLERNANFLEEQLGKTEHAETKCLLDGAFKDRILFFIGKGRGGKVNAKVQEDIEHIFNNIVAGVEKHFALNFNKLTLGRFVKYLESVLMQVNGNEKITFPDVLQATYEQFAQNKIKELKQCDMEECKRYHNEDEVKDRLMKIEKKKEEFKDEVQDYKVCIQAMVDKFLMELEEFQKRFEMDNENIGNEEQDRTEEIVEGEVLSSKIQVLQQESSGVCGGIQTGASAGSCGGNIAGGLIGAVGGAIIGGIFGGQKQINKTVKTIAMFKITVITLKNGTSTTEKTRIDDKVTEN